MGSSYTLTDLVADVLGGLATVVSTVKAGVNAAWDGIKAAGQFIADTVIALVLEGIKTFVTTLFTSLVVTLSVIFDGLEVQSISPLTLLIHDKQMQFSITVQNNGLAFAFGEKSLEIPRIFEQIMQLETLGIQEFSDFVKLAGITSLIEGAILLLIRGMTDKPQPPNVKVGILALFVAMAHIVSQIWRVQSQSYSPEMKSYLAQFHLFVAISMLNVWTIEFPIPSPLFRANLAIVGAILLEQVNVIIRALFAGGNFMNELLMLTAEMIGAIIGRAWANILIIKPKNPMMAIEMIGYFFTTYLFHILISSYFEFWEVWQ